MERSSDQMSDRAVPSDAQQPSCPMCSAELTQEYGTGICNACNWVRQFPAD